MIRVQVLVARREKTACSVQQKVIVVHGKGKSDGDLTKVVK